MTRSMSTLSTYVSRKEQERRVVYNHWTGTVDWNGGMEWWNHQFSRNEVKGHIIFLSVRHDMKDMNLVIAFRLNIDGLKFVSSAIDMVE